MAPGSSRAPDGSIFRGAYYHDDIDARGRVSFSGIFPTAHGIAGNPSHLGTGMFLADPNGTITDIAGPGDAARGGVLDFVYNGTINSRGDAAFGGHIAGEECIGNNPTDPKIIHCGTGVYMRRSGGPIVSVAHPGDPAPKGGVFRQAFNASVDDGGNVVFVGDLTPPPATLVDLGVFVYFAPLGITIPIARSGDAMPGGGHLSSVHFDFGSNHVNDLSQIVFPATLDSVTNGNQDAGIYFWSFGTLHLVARTGTVIPRVGTIAALTNPNVFSNVTVNDLAQIAFRAQLEDGRTVVLLASPTGI